MAFTFTVERFGKDGLFIYWLYRFKGSVSAYCSVGLLDWDLVCLKSLYVRIRFSDLPIGMILLQNTNQCCFLFTDYVRVNI